VTRWQRLQRSQSTLVAAIAADQQAWQARRQQLSRSPASVVAMAIAGLLLGAWLGAPGTVARTLAWWPWLDRLLRSFDAHAEPRRSKR
jgi:hypothetical protein